MLIIILKQMEKPLLLMRLLNKMKQLMKNQHQKKLNQKKSNLNQEQKHYQELKKVELVECEHCSKKMTLKRLRHSHPKNCKGAPTALLPVSQSAKEYKQDKTRSKRRNSE